jgi:hypothetical protein
LKAWKIIAVRHERRQLHKSLRGGFRVDDVPFQAHAFTAERKDCGCRSCSSGAQDAMAHNAPFKSRSIRWRPGKLALKLPRETRWNPGRVKSANREVPEWKKPHRIVSRASPDAEPRPGLKTRTSAYNPNGTMGASP